MNKFDWDENKRQLNHEKHGIDFVGAIRIFDDEYRIEMESVRNKELRYTTIGEVEDIVYWLCIPKEEILFVLFQQDGPAKMNE